MAGMGLDVDCLVVQNTSPTEGSNGYSGEIFGKSNTFQD